jgi:hypothetical protein
MFTFSCEGNSCSSNKSRIFNYLWFFKSFRCYTRRQANDKFSPL